MENKILLASIFALFYTFGFSQSKSFESYYNEAKEFTQNLKTYQVIIIRKDTSFAPQGDQVNQLKKYFSFLHTKTEVRDNPDFLINIIINDTNVHVNYTLTKSTPDWDTYDVRLLYDLNFVVEFDIMQKEKLKFPLCGYQHYNKQSPYPYTIQRLNVLNSNNKYYEQDAEYNKGFGSIEGRAALEENFLKKRTDFSRDFDLALRRFARDKCN